ncbi:MAG: hypothetical protein ABJO27_09980 [Pseudoruegeria sp.]
MINRNSKRSLCLAFATAALTLGLVAMQSPFAVTVGATACGALTFLGKELLRDSSFKNIQYFFATAAFVFVGAAAIAAVNPELLQLYAGQSETQSANIGKENLALRL